MGGDIIGLSLGGFAGFMLGLYVQYDFAYDPIVYEKIEQCESELPRNKQCEAVITARVKE